MAQHASVLDDGKRLDALQQLESPDTSLDPSFDRLARYVAATLITWYAFASYLLPDSRIRHTVV
jgi:hypothetical protein